MKKFTKLLGIVLIMALVMSMGITAAFAADEETATTGTITIKASEKNTEYDFYRILDLTGQDTTTPTPDGKYDVVSYTIASKWENFFKGTAAGAGYLIAAASATDAQKASLNQINFNGSVYYLNLTNDNVVAFTNAAMDYAMKTPVTNDGTKAGTGSDVSVAELPLGYYLMIPVDASIKTANSSGSVASITSTIPNADIQVKATKPSIEKIDDKVSADVGQTVTYTITGTMPNTAGYETYKYVIKDEMTSGLTFNKDVIVKLGDDVITTNCTIDYTTANKFSVDIPVMTLQGTDGANVGKTITITYTATVNDNAVASTQEKNKATLEYGHNPSELEKTTPIEEEVYTAKIVINKYTGDDASTGTKLGNAYFALMNGEGKYYKYTAAVAESGTPGEAGYVAAQPAKVEWVTVANAPTSGTAAVTDAMAKALADDAASETPTFTAKVTKGDGAAEFPGIADGTYYLVEFKAPDGYNRLDKPQSVTVTGTDADTAEGKVENKADATASFDAAQNATANVQNNSGAVLPSTGGIGTTIFYVVGSIMVVAAGVLLITKKRMSREG